MEELVAELGAACPCTDLQLSSEPRPVTPPTSGAGSTSLRSTIAPYSKPPIMRSALAITCIA